MYLPISKMMAVYEKILVFPPCTPKTYGDFWVFYRSFCWTIFFVYIFVTHEMTEKLSIRSVIYKLLAARKQCYRFFAKKEKSMIHYPKKKDYSLPEILLLEFVYKWLSNFVLFLPSQPPHPPDRACMTCIRPKKMCQFCYYDPNLLLWSKYTKHSIRISCFVYLV